MILLFITILKCAQPSSIPIPYSIPSTSLICTICPTPYAPKTRYQKQAFCPTATMQGKNRYAETKKSIQYPKVYRDKMVSNMTRRIQSKKEEEGRYI